ncbi:colorectal cancer-associated protein 1-like [Nycticebus coucang]|uniref:colorectal cancer-associated protein 1-like n=1 Tax=Nycticebus coucang TaxID=9470 RepID=UPI00234DB460|nr:colorectal cancer-associated protein 1-like [Nycticebus coucang]
MAAIPRNITEVDAHGWPPCAEGRQGWVRGELLPGSHGVCKDSSDLFVPSSYSFCLASIAGMDTPALLLANNFRTLDLPRPKPCFQDFFFFCFYDNTLAQILKSQMSCL